MSEAVKRAASDPPADPPRQIRKRVEEGPSIDDKTVRVFLVPHREPYYIHAGVLQRTSPFFRNAIGKSTNGSGFASVTLTDHEPATFHLYVQWLYTGYIYSGCEENAAASNAAKGSAELTRLTKCYILGTALHDFSYCNAVIDALIESVVTLKVYPASQARLACTKLPEDSPYRRLLVDFWVWVGRDRWMKEKLSDTVDAPTRFWMDVAATTWKAGTALYGGGSSRFPWIENRCQYHEHLDGEPRCAL